MILGGAVAVIFGLTVWLAVRPPLWRYTGWIPLGGPRVLPTRLVRSAVRLVAGHELPAYAKDVGAIIFSGRDVTTVFVRFHTDEAGVQEMLRWFGEGAVGTRSSKLDQQQLSQWDGFDLLSEWQKKLGLVLYDRSAIDSATLLVPRALSPVRAMLIDDQKNIVYLYAATED